MTRVISFLLSLALIPHSVMVGDLTDIRTKGTIQPHLWINLPEGMIIDYRARMWLGDGEDIPNGIFDSTQWGQVRYKGRECVPFPVNDAIGHILASTNGIDINKIVSELSEINSEFKL
ncbi:hypothetical protein PPM_p0079 (plasmid) [Paenibacillus polymyxa M1]|uniref:hypothetical protein n=1 Tax=Paenibacillus polymyxa TaxID=1406 RepID=UPI00021BBB3B|nr:hypothetical protein [Paenibacillus polymyxa]CCC86229.1 hypothetical protein PPM_p0079 [Paenibacillus polymyxa M1]